MGEEPLFRPRAQGERACGVSQLLVRAIFVAAIKLDKGRAAADAQPLGNSHIAACAHQQLLAAFAQAGRDFNARRHLIGNRDGRVQKHP